MPVADSILPAGPARCGVPAVRTPPIEGSHDIVGSTPAEFAATIQKDFKVWGDLARQLNVKVD